MIKQLLLVGALLGAPLFTEVEPTTEPVVEVVEEEESDWKEDFEKILSEFFTPEKVALIMSVITNIGLVLGLVVKFKSLITNGNANNKALREEVIANVETIVGQEFDKKTKNTLDAVLKSTEKTDEVLTQLVRIIALQQQGESKETKMAILDCVENLGKIGASTIKDAKDCVEANANLEEEKKEEAKSKVKKIIDDDGTNI